MLEYRTLNFVANICLGKGLKGCELKNTDIWKYKEGLDFFTSFILNDITPWDITKQNGNNRLYWNFLQRR